MQIHPFLTKYSRIGWHRHQSFSFRLARLGGLVEREIKNRPVVAVITRSHRHNLVRGRLNSCLQCNMLTGKNENEDSKYGLSLIHI